MTAFQKTFDKSIWEVVSQIAVGRVMSYGEVARAAGYPRHARMVARAMSRSEEQLPWHRVVKSDRTIAFEKGSEPYKKQQALLLEEGVKIKQGKVVPVASDKNRALDEVLWGPGNDT
ncbi:MGMT family protein [Cocleimonas sp. KMM 6892]|uniref:MGMT family protein n=1 Tax=unclassified Cocleimonas TaxID=2639732 RepID=UPI002DBC1FD0|nr:MULTISPECIES: MGMT family protein [unclassified Cocleimonas]MEB8431307.1 MGMT family protein [Cocleimonas sp. KMM 6892]MEC4713921.1 MGMT family protein [Cocleimonas sp. KMM 6895]MEC4743252.1 MGMT family protein [Cocleimonas sp. KMM 6896]